MDSKYNSRIKKKLHFTSFFGGRAKGIEFDAVTKIPSRMSTICAYLIALYIQIYPNISKTEEYHT